MNDLRLKNLVYQSISDIGLGNIGWVAVITISSIIYKGLKNIEDELIQQDQMLKFVAEQARIISDEIYVGYLNNITLDDIEYYAESINVKNFKFLTNIQISKIVDLYYERAIYVPFSGKYFDSDMYKIPKNLINTISMRLLRSVHVDVMKNIINYYRQKYDNVIEGDLEIINAILGNKPGKIILFKIKNIPTQSILNDLYMKRIDVSFNSVSESNGIIELVTNI